MSGFLTVLKSLVFPPRCAGCNQLLPTCDGTQENVFCKECAEEWEREMRLQCPHCFAPYCECRCQPRVMQRAGSMAFIKLSPYGETQAYRVVHRMILDAKKHPRRRVLSYVARELAVSLSAFLQENNVAKESVVITHLPRHPRKRRKEGVDQALELARALAKATGLPHKVLLARYGKSREQKRLKAKERIENLKDEFYSCRDVQGAFVVLVDDLVTTGAGMSVAVKLLRDAGACGVLVTALAHTEKKVRE